eukprot:TRINITY_DN3371_c1_g1_i1.p1 TRINITY_DN3371_c1_g1~~TRINITY_DN3371_c1_g1_i1.p1  ORF type:complete len:233 (+),score=54.49 TRINITY_DN3371_c1_g1_i1:203-901(+)
MRSVLLILMCLAIFGTIYGSIGKFWQLTDLHLDPEYIEGGIIDEMCHGKANQDGASRIGEYLCDASTYLKDSVYKFVNEKEPEVDFILWTGDIMPHLNYSCFNISVTKERIYQFSEDFKRSFKGKKIIPALGNHDTFPVEDMAPPPNWLFSFVLEQWSDWLDENQQKDFLKGGYYTAEISKKVRFIVLNTALYYPSDVNTSNIVDPAGQMAWLKNTLQISKDKNQTEGKIYE